MTYKEFLMKIRSISDSLKVKNRPNSIMIYDKKLGVKAWSIMSYKRMNRVSIRGMHSVPKQVLALCIEFSQTDVDARFPGITYESILRNLENRLHHRYQKIFKVAKARQFQVIGKPSPTNILLEKEFTPDSSVQLYIDLQSDNKKKRIELISDFAHPAEVHFASRWTIKVARRYVQTYLKLKEFRNKAKRIQEL